MGRYIFLSNIKFGNLFSTQNIYKIGHYRFFKFTKSKTNEK